MIGIISFSLFIGLIIWSISLEREPSWEGGPSEPAVIDAPSQNNGSTLIDAPRLNEKPAAQTGGSETKDTSELAAAYGKLLRAKSSESVPETRKTAYDIRRFVANNELDDEEYEPLLAELNKVTDRLDAKRSGALRGSKLDQEWHEQLDLLADSLTRLYR